jgi:hypothetical protein
MIWTFIYLLFSKYNISVSDISWIFWAFLFEYFFLFFTFPACMIFQYRQIGNFNDDNYPLLKNGGYLHGERTYQLLSLITKTIILWQTSIGALLGDWKGPTI